MDVVELETLVCRLVGDATSFVKSMGSVVTSALSSAASIGEATRQVKGFSESISDYAEDAISALAALGAKSYLTEMLEAFQDTENTVRRLSAAIQANGGAVEWVTKDYDKFASAMSRMTTTSKNEVLNMLQQAESYGVVGEKAKNAVKNVIAARSANIHVSLRMATELELGRPESLNKVLSGLHLIHNPQMKAARAQEMLNNMFQVAKSEVDTSAGAIKRLTNTLTEFKADLGSVVADAIKPAVVWLQKAVGWLSGLSKECKTNIVLVLGLVAAYFALIPVWRNIGMLAGLVFNPVALALVAATAALIIFIHESGGIAQAMASAKEHLIVFKNYLYDTFVEGAGWVRGFVEENMRFIAAATLMVGSLTLIYVAVQILISTYAIWIIKKIAIIAFILVLIAVLVVVKVAMLLWTASIWLQNAAIATGTAIQWAMNAGLFAWVNMATLAKVATWLWNAALTVMNALLTAGIGLVIAFAAVTVLFAVFGVAAAAVYALYYALMGVVDLLLMLPTGYGPIAHIAGLFGQWFDILIDVVKVMTIDLPLAWSLVKASAWMAVLQIKDLWPPLWEFIKAGWEIVAELMGQKLIAGFGHAMAKTIELWVAMQRLIGIMPEAVLKVAEAGAKVIRDEAGLVDKKAMAAAVEKGKAAVDAFKVVEGDDTKKAKDEVAKIQAEVKAAIAKGKPKAEEEGLNLGRTVGMALNKGFKMEKFDAVLKTSAEALFRFTRFQESLKFARELSLREAPGWQGVPAAGPEAQQRQERKVVDANVEIRILLQEIRDGIRDKKGLVEVRPVGIA